MDAAKAADFGASLKDAEWHRGAGAGLFLIAPLVKINLDSRPRLERRRHAAEPGNRV